MPHCLSMVRGPFELRCVALHVLSPFRSVCSLKEVPEGENVASHTGPDLKKMECQCACECTHTHTHPAPRNHSGIGNGKGVPSDGNSELEQLNFSKSSATDQLGKQEALLPTPARGLSFSTCRAGRHQAGSAVLPAGGPSTSPEKVSKNTAAQASARPSTSESLGGSWAAGVFKSW